MKASLFEIEQLSLHGEPTAEPDQPAVAADDAVAGDDDGDGVGAVGGPHGADRGGPADGLRQLPVAPRLAVGDALERGPHLPLERGAVRGEWNRKDDEIAGEVGCQLAAGFGDDRRQRLPAGG